ncbi:TauD/TfdA dioxygenase family protein [Candidatus Poriferisocius sp.]|uniref:TauD/TfdA dioxygenase family protein n=1 Tax=Candidatus Poriferisocius sp. TaxID=3101276 RepID=UPI003B01D04A
MELTAVHPALGVEVTGVNLARPLGPDEVDELQRAFAQRHLVLVRGQRHIEAADQVRFAGLFGPVICDQPGVDHAYVSNARPEGIIRDGALLFHSDLAFTSSPVLAISLAAVDVDPDGGTVTRFANAQRALSQLSLPLRSRIEGAQALHLFDLTNQVGDRRLTEEELDPAEPRHQHPIVFPNPHNGHDVLYVNDMQTCQITGLDRSDSDALLGELFEVLYQPDNIYEHHWQPGDVIVWDNIALQHARPNHGPTPRTLRRVSLAHHTVPELVPTFEQTPRGY